MKSFQNYLHATSRYLKISLACFHQKHLLKPQSALKQTLTNYKSHCFGAYTESFSTIVHYFVSNWCISSQLTNVYYFQFGTDLPIVSCHKKNSTSIE